MYRFMQVSLPLSPAGAAAESFQKPANGNMSNDLRNVPAPSPVSAVDKRPENVFDLPALPKYSFLVIVSAALIAYAVVVGIQVCTRWTWQNSEFKIQNSTTHCNAVSSLPTPVFCSFLFVCFVSHSP